MFEETKELSDLKAFAEAQQKTLVQLTKKVKQLEEERDHLKKLLESTAPVIQTPQNNSIIAEKFLTSDQEAICRTQLMKLREIALDREMTLEETKKVEIFSKILAALENAPKTIKIDTKTIDNDDLMGFLEDSANSNEQTQ
jgi:hypothetical protein